MSIVFADTSFYLALLSEKDQYHEKTSRLSEHLDVQVVVTEFVLLEVANGVSAAHHRSYFTNLLRQLRADPTIEIVPATTELFHNGCDLFDRRPDKNWSLTDCISFAVMQQRGIQEALTADRHFEQAGFTILLS